MLCIDRSGNEVLDRKSIDGNIGRISELLMIYRLCIKILWINRDWSTRAHEKHPENCQKIGDISSIF